MKVLIADDEIALLEGLKLLIDWKELGFSLCAEARNGEEALDKIIKLEPELVLLDIRMPKMTGIEIVQKAREQGFQGHVIILSGYSDFTYAQTAIRYGVDYYLTKPIDEDELYDAVKKVRDLIVAERKTDSAFVQYREKAKDTILRNLLRGHDNPEPLDYFDLGLTAEVYQVVIYERFNQDSFTPSWDFAKLLLVTNKEHDSFEHLTLDERELIVLKGDFAMKRFENLLAHYDKNPQKGSPLDSLFLTYGRKVWKLSDLSSSFHDARSLLERRFFCALNQHVLGYHELPAKEEYTFPITAKELAAYPQVFLNFIHTYNSTALDDALKTLRNHLFYADCDITAIRHFLIDIYLQIKQTISHTYRMADIPFPANGTIIERIERMYYLYEIIDFLSEQFEMCRNAIGNPSSETVMDDILHYINHNFKDNLKLESIALLFGYNSSYLGKLFSKKVGESFNSYLDRVRIEKSKDLLAQQEWKVYEVAEKTGYKNVDYFHKKFKKYTGMSPAEFRRTLSTNTSNQ